MLNITMFDSMGDVGAPIERHLGTIDFQVCPQNKAFVYRGRSAIWMELGAFVLTNRSQSRATMLGKKSEKSSFRMRRDLRWAAAFTWIPLPLT
jgi:hypothetical protein